MITKPMKAATYVAGETELIFPLEATDKFDGIRCVKVGGKALSASFKPIGNAFIRNWIEANCPDGFDGEIMVIGLPFELLSGAVRRKDGEPDFRYHVFDYVLNIRDALLTPYTQRVVWLKSWWAELTGARRSGGIQRVILELPITINNEAELAAFEEAALTERGREGVMLRTANSPYKCGRATINEHYLIKMKRFVDAEAGIIGFEEEMANMNVATKDAFGRSKRSKHAENLEPKGTLGKLLCRSKEGVEFSIGTGFSAALRQTIWNNQPKFKGKWVTYKHQPHGAKEGGKPRIPVFLRFREKWDMTE